MVVLIISRLKKIQEKKKIIKQKAEAAKKAKGITNGKSGCHTVYDQVAKYKGIERFSLECPKLFPFTSF